MTLLAPTLEAFFTQHLAGHRQASPRTIGSYRDTCCPALKMPMKAALARPMWG
jgi:hypothetical protein